MNSSVDISGVAHNYSHVFQFEKNWDEPAFLNYLKARWTDSFIYASVYIVLIFTIKYLMQSRNELNVRHYLAVWSVILAVFSIAGSIRTLPELVSSWNHSFQYSICMPTWFNGVTGFWGFLFIISKAYELGDTIFIVLRKRPLIFLHWYHHVTVLIYTWYSYTEHTAAGRWFMVMNYVVHSVMYSYYAMKAMRLYVPKQINMLITAMQLLQMIFGCVINITVYFIKNRGEYCNQTYTNLGFTTAMYFSYFILFANFFYNTYFVSKKSRSVKRE